jgi:IS5 family transposase
LAGQGGLNTKVHLAVDAHGMSVRVIVTAGTVADSTVAPDLTADINADATLADKGYDSQGFVDSL